MKTNKFNLYKETAEVRKSDAIEGCTYNQEGNREPVLIKSFDNKEDALKELKNYDTYVHEYTYNNHLMCQVEEYYVEENIYDEDDEFVESICVWEFSTFPTSERQ